MNTLWKVFSRKMGKKNMMENLSPCFAILMCQISPRWIWRQMKKHIVYSWKLQLSQGWSIFSKITTNLKWTQRRVHVVAAEEEREKTSTGSLKINISDLGWSISWLSVHLSSCIFRTGTVSQCTEHPWLPKSSRSLHTISMTSRLSSGTIGRQAALKRESRCLSLQNIMPPTIKTHFPSCTSQILSTPSSI